MGVQQGIGLSIVVNGQHKQFAHLPATVTLDILMSELELQADRIAVELNGEIAARMAWPSLAVKNEDRLEIVHFVGGGLM